MRLMSALGLDLVIIGIYFAIIIGIVACHQGLVTRGGPRGIGRSVTKAVVNSIVLILMRARSRDFADESSSAR